MPQDARHFDSQRLTFLQVVSASAALQLLPENATCFVRLHHLSDAALQLCDDTPGSFKITPQRLKNILSLPEFDNIELRVQEDAYNDTYVHAFPFDGGNYLLGSGTVDDSVQRLADLVDASFSESDSPLPEAFVQRAIRVVQALLRVSDLVMTRAGLARWEQPHHQPRRRIHVPDRTRLTSLVDAITFDLPEILSIPGMTDELLEHVCMTLADCPFESGHYSQRLIYQPLLCVEQKVVVINPIDFASTIRMHVLRIAHEESCLETLGRHLRMVVAMKSDEILRSAGFNRSDAIIESGRFFTAQYTFDSDKRAQLVVTGDPLCTYEPDQPFDSWGTPEISQEIAQIIDTTHNRNSSAGASTFFVVMLASIGREVAIGLSSPADRDALIYFDAPWKLDLVAESEDFDSLKLWYFARAMNKFHARVEVTAMGGVIDEYAIYRMRESSFYLSDEAPPDFASIVPGSACEEVQEFFVGRDSHAVLDQKNSRYFPVRRLHRNSIAPVYVTETRSRDFGYVCELEGSTVLFVPVIDSADDPDVQELIHLAESCCLWWWQVVRHMPEDVKPVPYLRVEIVRDQSTWWKTKWEGEVPAPSNTVAIDTRDASATLRFGERFAQSASVSNNADIGVINGLMSLIELTTKATFSNRTDYIAHVTSNGQKRLIHVLNTPARMHLAQGILKPARLVQEPLVAVLLDRVGHWLTTELDMQVATVPDDQRKRVLNNVVEFCFKELCKKFALLSPDSLIEKLIENNEAIVRLGFEDQWMLSYRIAFFGEESSKLEALDKKIRAKHIAATASRFLVEYAAAQPPSGTVSLTNECLDECMALAAEIISRATLSDVVNYGLGDPEISILPSGRLGVDRTNSYYEATEKFSRGRTGTLIKGALTGRKDESDSYAISEKDRESLEQAAIAEFGYGFTDLAEVTTALWRLAYERGCGSVTMRQDTVVEHVVANTALTSNKAIQVIERLTLKPRNDFFADLGPDVYPWRYNRSMSYLRRPLIRTSDKPVSVTWGMRNVYLAGSYLYDLCITARFKAESKDMRVAIGTIRNRVTSHFVHRVAQGLPDDLRVSIGVHKVGSTRIQRNEGQPLGDIDILAIDRVSGAVYLLEVKDFEVARTPAELANEVHKLIIGDASAVAHHHERVEWFKSNRNLVIDELRLDPSRTWEFIPRVVVSEMLVAVFLHKSAIPIVTPEELYKEVDMRRSGTTPVGKKKLRRSVN